ncbi:MAG: CHAT domain-containing protein [Bryobacterales bacterium]|nr:CHAT domain-containing protein [Bryobacterales bacterium]
MASRSGTAAVLWFSLYGLGLGRCCAFADDALELTAGLRLTRSLAMDQVDRFLIRMPASSFLHLEAGQTGTDVRLTLRNPKGEVEAVVDGGFGEHGPETLLTITEAATYYTLEISPSAAGQKPGTYTLAVLALRPVQPSDREPYAAHRHYLEGERLRRLHTPESRRAATVAYQAAAAYFRAGDPYRLGLTLTTMSLMQVLSGDYRGAVASASEAARALVTARDAWGEMIATNNWAAALEVLGESRRALELYRHSLDLARRNRDDENIALRLNNIGVLEGRLGNSPAAIANYERALSTFRQLGDRRRQALVLKNIGVAYLGLGDLDLAVAAQREALSLYRQVKDQRGEADTLLAIGALHLSRKQWEPALQAYRDSLAVSLVLQDAEKAASTRARTAFLLANLGRLPEARQQITEAATAAASVQSPRTRIAVWHDAARVFRLSGDPRTALAQVRQAVELAHRVGDRSAEVSAMSTLALCHRDLGQFAQSKQHIEEALALMEEIRSLSTSPELRALYLATQQESFGFYIDLLVRMDLHTAALEAAERSRARSLLEMLTEARADIRKGVDPDLLDRERLVAEKLNATATRLAPWVGRESPGLTELRRQLQTLETEHRDILAAIRKSSPEYASLTQPAPVTLASLQSLLDPETLLLEYAVLDDRSFLWLVSRDAVRLFPLPGREPMEAAVREATELLIARGVSPRGETAAQRTQRIAQADAALPAALQRLSALMLAPAAALLSDKRLLLVADGPLQRAPFAALPLPDGATPLIARHELVMLPSASTLAALRANPPRRAPAKLMAIFADPVFGSNTTAPQRPASRVLTHDSGPLAASAAPMAIPPLPYTRAEAQQILRFAKRGDSLAALGHQATRAAALDPSLADYRYLHFATHGLIDDERPGLSSLVLSMTDQQGRPLDGFLRANEIYNLRLSADLVVLSACQTALGREIRGEGLISFTRAFFYAGAPRLVVSLWNVNDQATATLMTAFYQRLLREGKRPAAALREAQLELSRQKAWASPYYWAPFVQHGEWR